MNTRSLYTRIIAIFVSVVMLVAVVLGVLPKIKLDGTVKVRNISINQESNLSHEEKAAKKLEVFNQYEISIADYNDDILKFCGDRTMFASEFSECEFVCMSNEEIDIDYDIECNRATTEIAATITYSQDDNEINQENIHVNQVIYDEETQSTYIYFDDGMVVNSSELLNDDNYLDNCVVGAATAAITVTFVEVVVVVLVAVVVYKVLSWFFPWLAKKITSWRYEQKTTYKPTTIALPALNIDGVRYETKAKTKAEVESLPRKVDGELAIYYLAFASGIANNSGITDTFVPAGGLYIGDKISYEQAVEVMKSSVVTEVTRDNVTYSFIPSIYSYYESDIINVMNEVGYHTDTPILYPEWHSVGDGDVLGVPHYHPSERYDLQVNRGNGTKTYRHHAFFTQFDMSVWNQFSYS